MVARKPSKKTRADELAPAWSDYFSEKKADQIYRARKRATRKIAFQTRFGTLQGLKRKAKEGDGWAILQVLCLSFHMGREPPKQIMRMAVAMIEAWTTYEVRTLDEAFGVERKKGLSLNHERKMLLGLYVFRWIESEREKTPKPPLDVALFELAGAEFAVSQSAAREVYYYWKKKIGE